MVKNIAQSVKQRLLNQARQKGLNFNDLMDQYVRERFLYRLSQSNEVNNYILKGASVFQVWRGIPHRPTKDIDLLGFGSNDPAILKAVFEKVLKLDYQDGIDFREIETEILQKGQKYEGVRLNIQAKLGNAKLFLQVDVGYGHVVTPSAKVQEFPALLNMPSPKIRVYPPETVIAEKLETMVSKGANNSRIKDYYDCLFISQNFEFKGNLLKQAIKATFEHRQTPFPDQKIPWGLSDRFVTEQPTRNNQWKKLVDKGSLSQQLPLTEAIAELREFLLPPLIAAAKNSKFDVYWSKDEKWQEKNLYEIYSKGVTEIGLAGSQKIAMNALKDGVEREAVIEMMQNHDPEYRKLVDRGQEKMAEKAVITQAEVKLRMSQMPKSQQQSQTQEKSNDRGLEL